MIEINKCQNCGGLLVKTERKGIYRCESCDSEFALGEGGGNSKEAEADTQKETGAKKDPKEPFSKTDWFEYRVAFKDLLKGPATKEAMNTFEYCINELGTSDEIMHYIKRELPDIDGLCWERHREEKLNAFLKKALKGQIGPNDPVFLYANSGIFSSGKHGFVVSDKKVVFSEKKPETLWYSELQKIGFDFEDDFVNIRLNGQYATSLSVISGGSDKPHGAIAALICALAFEEDPKRDRIILYEYKEEF